MAHRPLAPAAWLAAAALASSSCTRDVASEFPMSVGYQPLETCTATDPPLVAGAFPAALGDAVTGGSTGAFSWAHRRGYVSYPVAEVWQALHDCPCVSRIRTNRGFTVTPDVESFPLSFDIHVVEDSGVFFIGNVDWTLRYRGGPVPEAGGPTPPVAYGLRYQKIYGIANIRTQSGSLQLAEATRPDGTVDPGTTELAFVIWLDADRSGPADALGGIGDWYADLSNVLASGCGACPAP